MTWTIEALAVHFDKMVNLILARMQEMEAGWARATDLARENSRLERERASSQIDDRLAGMNEFRDAMKDQASRFVTRSELGLQLDALCDKIDRIEKRENVGEGKSQGMGAAWGYLITAVSAVTAILLVVHTLMN